MHKLILIFLVLLLLSAPPMNAKAAPLKVCLVSGSAEYDSDTSLTAFKPYLEEHYNIQCTLLKAQGFEDLPGLEALDDCDVALFFTRRLTIEGDQLNRIKNYCLAGKPIVAIRTASHGFQNWLEFDKLILGGNYQGHFGNGPTQTVIVIPEGSTHPVLNNLSKRIRSRYSLYKTAPLADDTELLMTGSIPGQPPQPVTWTRTYKGARVFYTALGGVQDFQNSTFRQMVANALFWAAKREVKREEQPLPSKRPKPDGILKLRLRTRTETSKGSDEWREKQIEKEIPVAKTAILICDMWDKHWSSGATGRCQEIAAKMAPVINAARNRGVQIIHAPSDTMYFYADWPQRIRMQLAPSVPTPKPLDLPNHPLPIDDSDGGSDTDDTPYSAWTRQNPAIQIGEFDGISDDGQEVYNFLQQEGIDTLIIMGVHTNMCVLGRSFAIRQMTRWGIQCILVRDLTDTMYDPKDHPYVSHDEGTELVVQHIEKYWCPSILSKDLIAGLPQTKR
ncbi:MAG: isochorismatase family protein [bacterium]